MNHLRTFLAFALLALALPLQAQRITMTVVVTNRAVTSNSFTANGSVRVFTNVTAATTVATNLTSINATKTNLFNQIAAFPFSGITLADGNTNGGAASNTFRLIAPFGSALSGSITGISASVTWGFLTLSTQSGLTTFPMLYPVANIPQTTNQTNQASDYIAALNVYPTNFVNTNASAFSNYVTKGAHSNQVVTSPVRFTGNLSADKQLLATNGFTSGLTNINSVSSNHVNFGRAIQSPGPGTLSLQVGTNAWALGYAAMAIGNDALASNSAAPASSSLAIGNGATATNDLTTAVGSGAIASKLSAVAIGQAAISAGQSSVAIGTSASVSTNDSIAIGSTASASSRFSVAVGNSSEAGLGDAAMAIGFNSTATNELAMAIGPSVVSSNANTAVLGLSIHRVVIPGFLEVEGGISNLNTRTSSTNLARGSWSYPSFALATLAAGNNISVPFGTNVFIRCNSGPASAATICGIIGGATSGGNDGQIVEVFNDTGFSLVFAVNTVDPIARNRINTPLGTDVTIADQGYARLIYDGTDERWKVISPFSVTASATNAVASVWSNGVAIVNSATNIDLIYGAGINIRSTNTAGKVDVKFSVDKSFSTNGTSVTTDATNVNFISTPGGILATNTNGKVDVAFRYGFTLFTITNDIVITNTLADTSCLSNLLGSKTIPANFWKPGMTIDVDLFGKYFGTGSPVQSNSVYYGASLLATNLMTYFAATTGDQWEAHFTVTCRTTGASGSLYCQGFTWLPSAANGVSGVLKGLRMVAGAVTVDTTAATDLDYKFLPAATTTALHIHAGTAKVTP